MIHILLVEDDDSDFLVTKAVLGKIDSNMAYKLDRVATYEEGLQQILEHQHDVYLIDYKLGDKDGLDLIRAVQAKGHTGPYIILTSSDDSNLYQEAIGVGVYDYLLKSEISPSMMDRTIRYVMERKRAEAALIAEKEFSSFIVSEIPYLVISVNRDGVIASINPFVTQITGRDEDYFLGRDWKTLIADEEQRDNIVFNVTHEDQISFDATLMGQDEKEHHIVWNVLNKKMDLAQDRNVSFVLSGKDMTELMESEAAERQREKTEALGHLAGGVAHEINNLLQPILFSADIIKSRVDDEKLIQSTEKIMRNTVGASKIVDDILTFARKDSTNLQDVLIVQALRESLIFLEDMIPPSITIQDDVLNDFDDCTVRLNKTDMMRVVKNTVINACHAMNDEGVVDLSLKHVVLDQKDRRLSLPKGRYVVVGISDKGCGISEEALERIYDPFFTTKETGEGTGLGLSIVYNIVRSWGGGVDVESVEGSGTTFFFYIPVLTSAA